MIRLAILSSCALGVSGIPAVAQAQDHSTHTRPASPSEAQEAPMDHSAMDHSAMEDGPLDNSSMDNGAMDHAAMDHGAMGHDQDDACIAIGYRPTMADGSGTSRLPANAAGIGGACGGMPMGHHGAMVGLGDDAMLMLHGFVWPVYTSQSGPRGDDKFYVQSMGMAEITKPFEGGKLTLRTMMSLEPAMRHDGYPNLFATGEVAYGEPLVDRQHPHDLFMELAGKVDFDLGNGLGAFVYGGPVGEPALGPSAFMHRASAQYNPEAPITHHWFDSTHIAYGVVTAGLRGAQWQLEGSAFRGREPDEFRWNIEKPKLDSWSVRASFAPSAAWLIQASYGQINDPEELHPGEDEHRFTTSAHYDDGRGLSAMAAYSAKDRVPGETLTAWLGEVNWDLTQHHTLFGRIENVKNDELFPEHTDPLHDTPFRVTKLQAGYAYRLPLGPAQVALGGTLAAFLKPAALDPYYGRSPLGYTLFAKISLGG